MSTSFDPYYKWLGISPAEQPPNHYRLLGITLYESNPDVISNAADRQMAHIRTFQSGKYSKESQKLLNELSAARIVLLDPAKRTAYDAQLRASLYASMQGAYPMGMGAQPPMPPVPPMGMGAQPPMPPVPQMGPVRPSNAGKKYRKSGGEDPTKLYVAIGAGILLLLLVFFLMPSGSHDETLKTAEVSGETPAEEEINPDEFDYGLPVQTNADPSAETSRPVQENTLSADSEAKTKAKKEEEKEEVEEKEEEPEEKEEEADFGTSLTETNDETDDETDEASEKKKLSEEENESDDAEATEDEDSGNSKKLKKKKKGESSETDSEKKKDDSGISSDGIKKLGRGSSLRMMPKRKTMLDFYAGKTAVQPALDAAVEWLVEKQIKDKTFAWWCFDHTILPGGKRRPGGKNLMDPGMAKENLVSATTLALMAIVGSGDLSPKNQNTVMRAIKFLQVNSKPASDQQIVPMNREAAKRVEASLVVEENSDTDFHPHAWGVIAICDYLAMEHEKKEKKEKLLAPISEFAQALVRHLCRQQNSNGGFPAMERGLTIDGTLLNFNSDFQSDIVSTVWNLMAMKAAKEAGLTVPNETIRKANDFLSQKITTMGRIHKGYLQLTASEIREIRAAFLGIQLMDGEYPSYEESAALAEQILRIYDVNQVQSNLFSSMFVRDLRGRSWENWRETVISQYLKEQCAEKLEAGSWFYDGERVNNEGGRLYCTAMTAMILQGLYRYEPLRPLDEYESSVEAMAESGDAGFAMERPPLEEEEESEAGAPDDEDASSVNALGDDGDDDDDDDDVSAKSDET